MSSMSNEKQMDLHEEILSEMGNRFVLFPIKYNSVWQMYKKAESAFWTAEEIDLSKDMNDWEKLSENEQFFVKNILAFFAGSDGIVNENLSVRFMNDVKIPEARAFYGFQIAIENIHCVSRDTEIMTSKGYLTIGNLEGRIADVWNGKQFSKVMVMKTSQSAPVYRVTLSNGMELVCTPTHDWLIAGEEKRIKTDKLKPGMTVQEFDYPDNLISQDDEIFSNIEIHGYMSVEDDLKDKFMPAQFNCRAQFFVPVNFSTNSKVSWLNGVMKHASINFKDIMQTVNLSHFDREYLKHLQMLLTTMNVRSEVSSDEHGKRPFKLTTNVYDTNRLIEHGVIIASPGQTQSITQLYGQLEYKKDAMVVSSVEDLGVNIPTYCFEEPLRHMGVFNGILTGQSETYSLLIDTYIKDNKEKTHLLNAINTIPCIKKKAEWAIKWIQDSEASFAKRIVAFACVEGIFFSGAFCSIFWLKERGLMPGLCLSNEFISRDESLHTEFAVLLYSMLKEKLSQETIHEIIQECVVIEDEFINDSIPCNMLGMNSTLMTQYIKFVADRLVVQLGYEKIYHVQNPFHFMDRIGLSQKTNFFEGRESSYARANVGDTDVQNVHKFSIDEEF